MVRYREILERLIQHQVEFFVIGGVAAILHGSPVVTMDVDICTTFEPDNLKRILAAVEAIHPRLRMRPDKMPLPMDLDRLIGLKNLYLLTDLGILDLLGELPEIGSYEEISAKTITMDVGGTICRVLDIDTLIAAKKAAGRRKDHHALWHLEAIRKMRNEPNTEGERD